MAGYLLDCCHSVSLHLVPDTLGRVNREVDHYFVIRWDLSLRIVFPFFSFLFFSFLIPFYYWCAMHVYFHAVLMHVVHCCCVCVCDRLIQNLLWSAKLRFEEAADSTGVEMCDT